MVVVAQPLSSSACASPLALADMIGTLEPHPRRSLLSQVAEVGVGRAQVLVERVANRALLQRTAYVYDLAAHPRRSRWRGMMSGSPQPFGERLLTRRSSLSWKMFIITVKLLTV